MTELSPSVELAPLPNKRPPRKRRNINKRPCQISHHGKNGNNYNITFIVVVSVFSNVFIIYYNTKSSIETFKYTQLVSIDAGKIRVLKEKITIQTKEFVISSFKDSLCSTSCW